MPALAKILGRGEVECMSTDKLLAIKWKVKREVQMLTILHKNTMKLTGEADRSTKEEIKKKTECILDYNENIGSVDKSDMLFSSVESVDKTVKWYKKLFFHMVDLSLLNSHVIYKTTTGKNISLLDFQLQLVKQLLEAYYVPQSESRNGRRSADGDKALRLTERHFVSMIPATQKKISPQRKCVVCVKHDKRSDTRYMCRLCNVPLCLLICFERYHSCKIY